MYKRPISEITTSALVSRFRLDRSMLYVYCNFVVCFDICGEGLMIVF